MRSGTTRRGFLGTAAASLLAVGAATARDRTPRADHRACSRTGRRGVSRRGGPDADGFDPAVHGFGFRNWSTSDPAYPEHDHDAVDEEQIRRVLGRRWPESVRADAGVNVRDLPGALLDAIAKQLYVSVNQQSATDGHCYGMVFAAQQYYEHPDTLRAGRSVASDLAHPEAPAGDDGRPASREIDLYQLTQFLNVHAWLGRRAMAAPELIDYRRQLDRVTSVVDEFDTASVTLFDRDHRRAHQVLVYDYRRDSDRTRLFVYDPNYPARRYERVDEPPAIDVATAGDRPTVRRYDGEYGEFVFNRRDRLVAAQTAPGPGSLLAANPDRLREAAFRLALFVVDSPGVSLTVVGPNDRPLGRDTATYMDRGRSAYARMRYRYGFAPGTYRIRIAGRRATEYTLEALVADDAPRLDATTSASIGPGEVHRYTATAPDDGTGSLERVSAGRSPWLAALGGAGLGAGVAGGYAYLRCRDGASDRGDSE
ncbi:hypothetical protein [Halorussus marinus]|uniref:hypothetical protein n=1 Tax=Halorussus marinus TaxID=2505976 RepID=UPI00106E6CEE|nr:hypothetical protein [Halorussus marinus]